MDIHQVKIYGRPSLAQPFVRPQNQVSHVPVDRLRWQVLGGVVLPARAAIEPKWFWFTRYDLEVSGDPDETEAAKNGCEWVGSDNKPRVSFVKIRCAFDDAGSADWFWREIQAAASGNAGLFVPAGAWRRYDYVGDLSASRYIAPNSSVEQKQRRADHITGLLHSYSKLVMDQIALDPQQGWLPEINTDAQNPAGSILESIVHLLCNAGDPPLPVFAPPPTGHTYAQADAQCIGLLRF